MKSQTLLHLFFGLCSLGLVHVEGGVVTSPEFLSFPAHGQGHRSPRLSLGTSVNTGECAHIGRNCFMQRDKTESPSTFTYVPCCKALTCQGIGPVERRNAMGQAHSSDDNTFSGICTLSLDNGGGDVEAYKEYLKGQ